MKIQLAQNISRMRRERGMTQEKLAEALGVTFAAVSKWERGAATPELSTIMELADLFSVSVDALLGYQMRSNDLPSVVERLRTLSHTRENCEWQMEAGKALERYPNSFEAVYRCAVLYSVRGLDEGNETYARKALSLFEHALRLMNQNTDENISITSIQQDVARTHMLLGETEKGLAILKKHNPCGVHNALIGTHLACVCNKAEEALSYLSEALLDLTMNHYQLTIGYLNAYLKMERYADAEALLAWSLGFYAGLKEEGVSHLEKGEAALQAAYALVQMKLNRHKQADEALRSAWKTALHFDAAPNYDASHMRFVECGKPATSHDDLGETAVKAVEAVIGNEPELVAMWAGICRGT